MKLIHTTALLTFVLTTPLVCQGVVSVPIPDAITVTGTAGANATATVDGDVDTGGDIAAGTGIGHARFEAEIAGLTTSARGKADIHGFATAVDGGSSFGNRGVLKSYLDVGGQAALARNANVTGATATFTFSPVWPYRVEGFFRIRFEGELFTFGAGTGSGSASGTAAGGAAVTVPAGSPAGVFRDTGGIVELPQTGTLNEALAGTVNAAGRTRGKIEGSITFVPTKIWTDPVVVGGFPLLPEIVVYER